MKVYILKSDDNDFSNVLNDYTIMSKYKTVVSWTNHLMLGTEDDDDVIESYLMLKYGEQLVSGSFKDFTPIPYVDYQPDPNRPEKFKDVYNKPI